VNLIARNRSGTDGTMLWVDFACAELPYHLLNDGDEATQSTFSGHVWIFRDFAGRLVDQVTLDETTDPVWEIQR
jgi:hypothetical protein